MRPRPKFALAMAGMAALLSAALLLATADGSPTTSSFEQASASAQRPVVAVRPAPRSPVAERPRRGRRGRRGAAGPSGFAGEAGPQGPQGSPVIRQPISIDWQNNQWQGQDSQRFFAPGIGEGNVTCRPPYFNGPADQEPGGTQWVQFFPGAGPGANVVMWTTRFGGPDSDASVAVTRRAGPLDKNSASFFEGMNTQPAGYDQHSAGMFVGIISSRPEAGGDVAAPTTFVLNWHWNFDDGPSSGANNNRCFVAGSFYTQR